MARFNERPVYGAGPRPHRATFAIGCAHCRCKGIEPGYKRKKCSACAGSLTFAMPAITPMEWADLLAFNETDDASVLRPITLPALQAAELVVVTETSWNLTARAATLIQHARGENARAA